MPVNVKLPEASAVVVAIGVPLLSRTTVALGKACEVEQSGEGPPQARAEPETV